MAYKQIEGKPFNSNETIILSDSGHIVNHIGIHLEDTFRFFNSTKEPITVTIDEKKIIIGVTGIFELDGIDIKTVTFHNTLNGYIEYEEFEK